MKFNPLPSHVAWAENIIRTIRDGGEWTWAENGLRFKFNKKDKTITVQNPSLEFKDEITMTEVVFERCGYKLVLNEGPVPEPLRVDHMIMDTTGEKPVALGWNEKDEDFWGMGKTTSSSK